MQDPNAPISLGLSSFPVKQDQTGTELQFQRAEPTAEPQFQRAETLAKASVSANCSFCKRPIEGTYFHIAGQVACAACTEMVDAHLKAPPASSLPKAALYGGGAALGASIVYAMVTIITGLQIGLIALVVGFVVAKAILHASGGRRGKPHQILAVVLTYLAITTSYVPVAIYRVRERSHAVSAPAIATSPLGATDPSLSARPAGNLPFRERPAVRSEPLPANRSLLYSLARATFYLVALAAAAPFMQLSKGTGVLTLVMIFFAMFRAWRMTAPAEVAIMGPYLKTP